ncbi:hypothetical protein [Labrys monachus]|uniref:Glycosyltransferase n=1 Tax=Labrys monachus TaxID=217067 RepID=A0ABU0FC36_9HYPH|nr:hypothetical protein [Labrys monachus]MDQ0392169.1 hypothetical protein [Labrys monachus]
MNLASPRNVQALPFDGPLFSICSLVNNDSQYDRMLASFARYGFSEEDTEFIFVDNRGGNTFEAYGGLNAMLAKARGRYIICCHQDVELIGDGAHELEARLDELTAKDPFWAIVGNAGAGPAGRAVRISDPYGDDQHVGTLPAVVHSLDENFLLLCRERLIGFSADLAGFHLYGTDACLQAELRGFTAYVIDFHLRHHSRGNADASYFECMRRLEDKYGRAFRSRRILTTFKPLYITANAWRARFWRFRKWQRMRQLRLRRKQGKA